MLKVDQKLLKKLAGESGVVPNWITAQLDLIPNIDEVQPI
jgi:hypothetical protein